MRVSKSSRHSKITGDFAEALVLYWLSKYGFECARVDHTGIDIIARNPQTNELMGISVKGRSRNEGKEKTDVSLPHGDFGKAKAACAAFGCDPYFAIVVDAGDTIRAFILPMARLLKLFPKRKNSDGWRMTTSYLSRYAQEVQIQAFEFQTRTTRWWGQPSAVSKRRPPAADPTRSKQLKAQ